jgi:large subunit ribosomal protein L6
LPVAVPSGVDVAVDGRSVVVKGPKGSLSFEIHGSVDMIQEGSELRVRAREGSEQGGVAMAGTTRAILHNMVTGVSQGFERRLRLVGVGYRAHLEGTTLNLALGYSHPIDFEAPEGVTLEVPSQTEIVVRGFDRQKVGQAAAEIRAFRPPEPYKGKGVRYADENVVRKEAKKK